MGAQIAAHFANAGIPALLLDLNAEIARKGLQRALGLKPDPFFTPDASALITTGGFDTDFERLGGMDWILEAIIEDLDAKRALVERIEPFRRPGTIVSSNTSGISIAGIAEHRTPEFRQHWLGTHFFNPPRYLHLVEIVPTADTDREVVERVAWFTDHRLGKGVVTARDTPNFIVNHIGTYAVIQVLQVLESGGYTIEEIDAITGPAIGRPKSATFRTLDLVGLDVFAHVARNLYERLPSEARRRFVLPDLVGQMIDRGWIGDKAGQGFYKREKTAAGTEIFALDPATMTYRPRQAVKLPSLDAARSVESVADRIRMLFAGRDKVGDFLRRTLAPTLAYASAVAPEIAFSRADVDRATKWGLGWELGPIETMEAIGVRQVAEAAGLRVDDASARQAGLRVASENASASPAHVRERASGSAESGEARGAAASGTAAPGHVSVETTEERSETAGRRAGLEILKAARDRRKVVRSNAGASLIDIGDGVLAVEFHSKMNAIGGDTIEMLHAGLKEAASNFLALVVGNDAPDFSAGANLMLVLLEALEGNWDEIDMMVQAFQRATQALRYADVPVIVATAGRTLGGGCEIALHADRVQAAAESYIGLVEAGVGLVPAGGGCKELIARAVEDVPAPAADLLPFIQRVFETIGFAKVSTSAADAKRLGFLSDSDRVTMNRDRLMADAKALALERVAEGYRRPAPRSAISAGGETLMAALKLGVHLAWRAGRLTDHDVVVGRALAYVLAGGALPHQTLVHEQYLLDLEREVFLKLCGERKTLERIQHTLKTGKPLRN
jgi:3-hydroxyacyl-CoA dehydrogenase